VRIRLRRSGGDDVLRLRALLALRDVEADPLALLELTEALGRDVRVVGEDVRAAAVLLDETETLFGVEPLHSSLCHDLLFL